MEHFDQLKMTRTPGATFAFSPISTLGLTSYAVKAPLQESPVID